MTRIGPGFFDGSGLTRAACGAAGSAPPTVSRRGSTPHHGRARRPALLVYLYWGDLDKVGHVHGCQSWEWGDELEAIDAELGRLVRSVPSDTAVYITADHGMVDAPHALRIDIAHDAELAAGIRHVGESRARCSSTASRVRRPTSWPRGRERVAERAWIRSRADAVREGWFGPVSEANLPRIGDILVAARDNFAIVDSGTGACSCSRCSGCTAR